MYQVQCKSRPSISRPCCIRFESLERNLSHKTQCEYYNFRHNYSQLYSIYFFLGQHESNNTEKMPPEDIYPVMAKPSPSLQIIATRNRPCCECIRYNQRAPLCLLFLIFIVVSCSLITGVMFYLKSGNLIHKYTTLL